MGTPKGTGTPLVSLEEGYLGTYLTLGALGNLT